MDKTGNPYQSPTTTGRALPQQSDSFRSSFLWPFVWSMVWVALLGPLAWSLIHPPSALDLALELGGAAVAVAVMLLVAIRMFQSHLSEEGLRSYDCWGRYHTARWSEIRRARPISLLGLSYVRACSDNAPPLWIPLFLARPDQFTARLIELAGPEHPLSRFFTDRVRSGKEPP